MTLNVTGEHLALAQKLVDETHANGGLAPVDVEQFWADDAVARANPFGEDIPQAAFGASLTAECVYDELDIPEDRLRYNNDIPWRLSLNKAYNDIAKKIVGRRLLSESPPEPDYSGVKALHDIFEMENIWDNTSQSYWLHKSADNDHELASLLDRVDRRLDNLREFLLPDDWEAQKARLTAMGIKPPLYRGQRGPVTFAMSMYGVEGLILLIADNPGLAARLRDTILRAMLEMIRIHNEEAGYTRENMPRGFGFSDDNSAMLNAEMYEFFGYPIVKGVWDVCSPDPGDRRYQHSDSSMEHIMPVLGRCDLTGANFGPTVMVDEIRQYMPNAVIEGALAPFTYSRNEEVNMVAEFLRDFERSKEKRGLVFATAGSINNGSRLTGMRLLMAAIQRYGRFE